jgi:hypothetical protein
MDANGNLYSALEDEISAEDKARLDGYFRARRDLEREEAVTGIEDRVKLMEAMLRHDAH